MKVTGSISSKGVKGTITQKGVTSVMTQKGVTGSVVESGFDWAVYWATRYPSNLILTVNSSTQITLNWTNNGILTSSDSILIYESTDGVAYTLINTALYSASSYIRTGLTASTAYYYKIRYTRAGTYSDYCTPATATTASTYPVVIDDGNTVGWYLADELTTITKDGSNFVSRWNDKLASGRDLLQANGTLQPLWSADGILFDGVDNFMRCTTFNVSQPTTIYLVFKHITWTSNDKILAFATTGYDVISQLNLTARVNYIQSTIIAYNDNTNLTLDTFGILRVINNGANSSIQVNEQTKNTGTIAPVSWTTLAVGAYPTGTAPSYIQVKEIILRKVADNSTDETNIYNYLKTKYGL